MLRTLPKEFDPSRPGPAALIVVMVDWCGYCREFKPQLDKMQKYLSPRVYKIDGDADPRAREWASGYPTILYRASVGGLYRYDGPRTVLGIQKFADKVESRA